MTYLFIGGTNDGERISLPETPSYLKVVSKRPAREYKAVADFTERTESISTEHYRREELRVGTETVDFFYVHEGMDLWNAISMLLVKYKRP